MLYVTEGIPYWFFFSSCSQDVHMGLSSASTSSELASAERLSFLRGREISFQNLFNLIDFFQLDSCNKTGKPCELLFLVGYYTTVMTCNWSGSFCRGANYYWPKNV